MEYLVVAFRSRSDTVRFFNFISANGLHAEIVNTPKQAGVGCGLSVKVNKNSLSYIKRALLVFGESSFIGVFLVTDLNGKKIIRPI